MPLIRYKVTLDGQERDMLQEIATRGKHSSQKVLNALILLGCDQGPFQERKLTNQRIATVCRRLTNCVMDNLNTHGPGALYETFAPQTAKGLWSRFEFVYTPKHGSWLNMAEIELNVLIKQCLDRRIDTIGEMRAEAAAWENRRNNMKATINWQFTCGDARIKLRRLYPTLDD